MKAMILAALLLPAAALAQVPNVMSYQGRLLDSKGAPVTGTQSIVFAIYDSAENGNKLWADTLTVAVSNGFYSVKLGANAEKPFPQNLFDGNPRWLGVTVGLGAELAPRQYIATVPYAFKAAGADTATNASHAVSADSAAAATNANHAISADSAATATNASHATVADSATTATNLSGGSVNATSITVPGSGANIPGLVVGGVTPASNCGSSGCSTWCSPWGNAKCADKYATTPTCIAPAVLRPGLNFCILP